MAQPKKPGINLLPTEFRESGKLTRAKNLLKRTSFAVLGIYLISLTFLVGANFFLSSIENDRRENHAQKVQEVEALAAQEKLTLVAKERVKIAQNIFTTLSVTPVDLIQETLSSISPGILITQLEASEGTVNLAALAQNSSSLDFFFERFGEQFNTVEESRFTSILLDGLSRREDGSLSFSLVFK